MNEMIFTIKDLQKQIIKEKDFISNIIDNSNVIIAVIDSNGKFHLIEFSPQTGRMHQIRAHSAYSLKTPIVGDSKYGSDVINSNLFLHANKIFIPKEIFQKEIFLEVEPHEYFSKFIKENIR